MFRFIQIFCILSILFENINGACEIGIVADPVTVSLNFGSKKIINLLEKNFVLKADETITLKCSEGMWVQSQRNDVLNIRDKGIRSINVSCRADKFIYEFNKEYKTLDSSQINNIYCKNVHRNTALYESSKNLPYCAKGMSYGIGSNIAENVNIVNIGVCYDFATISLAYVTYLPYKSNIVILNEDITDAGIKSVDLNIQLNFFKLLFDFIDEKILNNSLHNMNELMILNEYKLDNIIQDNSTAKLTQEYDSIFNIIWWTNLKMGSWKYFERELKKQILLNNLYEVYSGTSGVVDIPSSSNCNETNELTFEYKNRLISVPKYIWSYLKPINNNKSFEFVVIGYNTPYISLLENKFICNDYCHQVDWLYGSIFEKIHLMPAHGIVICCNPEEAGLILKNLPFQKKQFVADSVNQTI